MLCVEQYYTSVCAIHSQNAGLETWLGAIMSSFSRKIEKKKMVWIALLLCSLNVAFSVVLSV